MPETLYFNLKDTEKINDTLKSRVRDLKTMFERFESLPGFEQFVEIGEIPEINVPEYQREIIQKYQPNYFLNQALDGEKPIEKNLEELSKINKGIRKILPRRKNPEHNQKVESMEKLIGMCRHLKAKGIFVLDNLVTGYVFGVGLTSIMTNLVAISGTDPSLSQQEYIFARYLLPFLFGVVLTPAQFIRSPHFSNLNPNSNLKERAQYLDKKIEELY